MKVCVCDCGMLGWQGCCRKCGVSVRKGKGRGKGSNQKTERKREKQGSKRNVGRSHGKRRGWRKGRGTLGAQFWTNSRCFSSKYEMKCSIGNCNFETTTTLMAENKEELKSL